MSNAGEPDAPHDEIQPTWADYHRVVVAVVAYGLVQPNNSARLVQIDDWGRALTGKRAMNRYAVLSKGNREGVIYTVESMRGALANTPASVRLALMTIDGIFPKTTARQNRERRHSYKTKQKKREQRRAEREAGEGDDDNEAASSAMTSSPPRTPQSQRSRGYETSQPTTPLPAGYLGNSPRPSSHGSTSAASARRYPMAMQQRLPNSNSPFAANPNFLVPSVPQQHAHIPLDHASAAPPWSVFAPYPAAGTMEQGVPLPNAAPAFLERPVVPSQHEHRLDAIFPSDGGPVPIPSPLAEFPRAGPHAHLRNASAPHRSVDPVLLNGGGPVPPPQDPQRVPPDPREATRYGYPQGRRQGPFFSLGVGAMGRRAARYYGTTPERWVRGGAW